MTEIVDGKKRAKGMKIFRMFFSRGRSNSVLFLVFMVPHSTNGMTCNGSEVLCSKRYNEITWLKTHNSTSTTQKKLLGLIPNPVANL
jgi:hypothetical protein